jgi:hypothetical protein
MKIPFQLLLLCILGLSAFAAEKRAAADVVPVKWITFPHPQLELRGLPWFTANAPELWRFPQSAQAQIPPRVWARAVAPDGGRIRFSSTTSQLALRIEVVTRQSKLAYFDATIDGKFAGSAGSAGPKTAELVLFADRDGLPKDITIYLPNTSEVRLLAVGVDASAEMRPASAFARPAPIVCYGSSVLQGTGAVHPAKTYPAALARRLNLDFVNLGFGGAGKAEPEVVALVNQLEASCYIFDLGKSYGDQTAEPFAKMLAAIRAAHPTVPILCVTPIFSSNELIDRAYLAKSVRLRDMMRAAAIAQRNAGDRHIHVVEGLELFGEADKALLHDPQHPNDAGNELMGERLVPLVKSVVLEAATDR